MLRTPKRFKKPPKPVTVDGVVYCKPYPREIAPGFVEEAYWGDLENWFLPKHILIDHTPRGDTFEARMDVLSAWMRVMDEVFANPDGSPGYGVCDTPEQLIADFGAKFAASDRTFIVTLKHVPHPPKEEERGGWRWEKWGPYVGRGHPRWDYLADEEEFLDGVWTFTVHELNPEALHEWEKPALVRWFSWLWRKVFGRE